MKSRKLMTQSKWWFVLLLDIVASLIAFYVSLFITEQDKLRAKRETAWNVAQVTLSNIDELINNYEIVTFYYDDFRNQYKTIKEYLDRNEQVPDSLCNVFISYIEGWDIFASNKSPEMTFNTTFELWDYLEDIPLIRRIGNCYAYCNAFLDLYNRDLQTIAELATSAHLDYLRDPYDKLNTIMKHIPFQNYMERSRAISAAYHKMIERLKVMNTKNKKDMNVTDEDLKTLVAPLYWASDENEECIFIVGPEM